MKTYDFEIIDCHIHPYINAAYNTAYFSGALTPDDFSVELKRAGITKACGSVISFQSPDTFDAVCKLNRDAVSLAEKHPDFFIPGIHVHPDFPEESCRELELMYKEHNVRWIGELVAYIMKFSSYSNKGAFNIYELAVSLGLPVNIHPNALEEIELIAKNFPRLNIVMAHPGAGKKDIVDKVELLKKYPNLYLDLSGSGMFRDGMLRYGIDQAGKEKFLFGTDYPICNPAGIFSAVLYEKLNDEELAFVFSLNFRRLTGLL
ncbi:MAG: hypothetical protein A2020_03570 [Lentisphaerae bacterium GWF2_45_14]|nr:MAG: hypothetical protein A2020_03570 [Lentisphaerae bacterium GWF2_45_14]